MTKCPLEDINWWREMMSESERRVRADSVSLNVDTTDGVLKNLQDRFQGKNQAAPGCRPIDIEKNLADYQPATVLPDLEEVRRQIPCRGFRARSRRFGSFSKSLCGNRLMRGKWI